MSHNNYIYYNANPEHAEEQDCVTRAIKLATGLSYEAVAELLEMSAEHYGCDKLCVGCYGRLLTNIFNYPIRYCDNGETVAEILEKYPNNILIIRIDGHLTSAVFGVLADIWDCTAELVDCYWIVN